MRIVRLALPTLLVAAVGAAACSGSPVQAHGTCPGPTAFFEGAHYVQGQPASASDAGALFGTALRAHATSCSDVVVTVTDSASASTGVAQGEWRDGDVVGVPLGTRFYTFAGAAPGARLVGHLPTGEWVAFERHPAAQ